MAILMRGGIYDDFDPNKLLPREYAVVLSNDPNTKDGRAIYINFGPGKTKRISTFEDMKDDMESAGKEIFDQCIATFNEILEQVQTLATQTEQYKDDVVSIQDDIVNIYMPQVQAAAQHAADARKSADDASDSAKLSESWAVGGTGVRLLEETDNSKYYSNEAADLVEEAKRIVSAATSGALIPAGTILFESLPTEPMVGYMYNISNAFTADERFEMPGVYYGEGNNVYWTADEKWDVLVGIQQANDFVGTYEKMQEKLAKGELPDGTTAYTDGYDNSPGGGDDAKNAGLIPGGTITYEQISESSDVGYVYCISNDFVTDERFDVGAGVQYISGTSVYWNENGKLSILSGIKPSSFSGTRVELDESMNDLPIGTVVFLMSGEDENVSIGRIEKTADGEKQFVEYSLSSGGGNAPSGSQVGNVQDLTLKEGSDYLALNWKDPDNVVFNGETIAEWAGTKVVRKEGSIPASVDDGVLVSDSTVKDQYSVDGLKDSSVVTETQYNYALFPYTTQNVYTMSDANRISGKTSTYDKILENNTWQQISAASVLGVAKEFWSIGDMKDGYVIVGFDHDDLADDSGKAGITFALKNVETTTPTKWIGSVSTYYRAYASTLVYSAINNIYNSLPDELKDVIKTVKKKTISGLSGSGASLTQNYTDLSLDCFAFSNIEITGSGFEEGTYYSEYDWAGDFTKSYWTRSGKGTSSTVSGTTRSDFWLYTYLNTTSGKLYTNNANSIQSSTPSNYLKYGFCV